MEPVEHDEHDEHDEIGEERGERYEAPAIESRTSVRDPLIGVTAVSNG